MEGLIVEPSRTYQKLLSSAIASGGLGTRQVSTGAEALKLLEQQSFDLIFIAMHLQDMDAPKFSSQLRADARTKKIPLVMVTSNEDKKLLDEAVSAGITEIFAKHELNKITSYTAHFSKKKNNFKYSGRILYIEENSITASSTADILRESGYTVDHYATGEEGIIAFQQVNYDLVLTDILLKGKLHGQGIIKALRQSDDNSKKYIPLLVFSVLNDTAHKVELLRLGANDYITKPLVEEELLVRVNNLITSKKLLDKAVTEQSCLQESALRDPLTGLYNRFFINETASARFREAARHNIPYSLIKINIDQLLSIKKRDIAIGDQVMKAVAALLTSSVRKEDVSARYQEEDFVVLLSHCNITNACSIAEKMRQSIEKLKPAGCDITASFGVAEMQPDLAEELPELCRATTEAIQQAQLTGGNKVIARSVS